MVSKVPLVGWPTKYLNSWTSLMTCMPCSKCSLVGFSPTLAKWPLTVMTEGAVGCLGWLAGRAPFEARSGVREEDMTGFRL